MDGGGGQRSGVRPYLLIDFGSTYTKVVLVDAAAPAVLAQSQAPTTAATDLRVGLRAALASLEAGLGALPRCRARLAASSAAGGLRMAAVGLVPDLTAEAARQAALGAGARVIATYAYRLDDDGLADLRARRPDMILLAGGTDGGNRDVILHNARMLAEAGPRVPVVYAGNAAARDEAVALLRSAGLPVRAAANVMPRLRRLDVDDARRVIRDLFMEHIVRARGLEAVNRELDGVLMPTPAAVLKAARLLADGPAAGAEAPGGAGGRGLGPLVVVDVGGATTDVHSIGPGGALEPGVELRGLEEPYEKRTVEGDLGVRSSAPGVVAAWGEAGLAAQAGRALRLLAREEDGEQGAVHPAARAAGAGAIPGHLAESAEVLAADSGRLPAAPWEAAVDHALARCCVHLAVRRHAGRLRVVESPAGRRRVQRGKDLRPVRAVIGTGGVIRHARAPGFILEAALEGCGGETGRGEGAEAGSGGGDEVLLLPRQAALAVDAGYLLAPMGLLAEAEPEAAFILMQRSLRWLPPPGSTTRGERDDS